MELYDLAGPALRMLPAEAAHHAGILALKYGLVPSRPTITHPRIAQTLWNLSFPNPVGMAAGFDKNAEVALPLMQQGFGFVECGTVTPRAQDGNPLPRMFRLKEDAAVINRLGFNNHGVDAFLRNVPPKAQRRAVLGLNIGKNKDTERAIDDYLPLLTQTYPHADYITVNISSPNTQGLRALQAKEALRELLEALLAARGKLAERSKKTVPLLVKVAPDLTQEECEDVAAVALEVKLDGLIVGNTTVSRPESLRSPHAHETGGLSGAPLFALSTQTLKSLYRTTGGQIPLVGVGGISSPQDAYAKIRAGASLVQLYSALAYQGFGLVERINRELIGLLGRDGFAHLRDAVGVDV